MPAQLIDKDNPNYKQLFNLWLEEKKPGYVTLPSGAHFRVFVISDEEVKFQPTGGIDDLYSTKSIN